MRVKVSAKEYKEWRTSVENQEKAPDIPKLGIEADKHHGVADNRSDSISPLFEGFLLDTSSETVSNASTQERRDSIEDFISIFDVEDHDKSTLDLLQEAQSLPPPPPPPPLPPPRQRPPVATPVVPTPTQHMPMMRPRILPRYQTTPAIVARIPHIPTVSTTTPKRKSRKRTPKAKQPVVPDNNHLLLLMRSAPNFMLPLLSARAVGRGTMIAPTPTQTMYQRPHPMLRQSFPVPLQALPRVRMPPSATVTSAVQIRHSRITGSQHLATVIPVSQVPQRPVANSTSRVFLPGPVSTPSFLPPPSPAPVLYQQKQKLSFRAPSETITRDPSPTPSKIILKSPEPLVFVNSSDESDLEISNSDNVKSAKPVTLLAPASHVIENLEPLFKEFETTRLRSMHQRIKRLPAFHTLNHRRLPRSVFKEEDGPTARKRFKIGDPEPAKLDQLELEMVAETMPVKRQALAPWQSNIMPPQPQATTQQQGQTNAIMPPPRQPQTPTTGVGTALRPFQMPASGSGTSSANSNVGLPPGSPQFSISGTGTQPNTPVTQNLGTPPRAPQTPGMAMGSPPPYTPPQSPLQRSNPTQRLQEQSLSLPSASVPSLQQQLSRPTVTTSNASPSSDAALFKVPLPVNQRIYRSKNNNAGPISLPDLLAQQPQPWLQPQKQNRPFYPLRTQSPLAPSTAQQQPYPRANLPTAKQQPHPSSDLMELGSIYNNPQEHLSSKQNILQQRQQNPSSPQQYQLYPLQRGQQNLSQQSRQDPSQQGQRYPQQQNPQYPSQQGQQYFSRQGQQYPSQLGQQYTSQQGQQYPMQQGQQYPTQQGQQYPTQQGQQYPTQQGQQYPTQQGQQYPTQQGQQYPTQQGQRFPYRQDQQYQPQYGQQYPSYSYPTSLQQQQQKVPTNYAQYSLQQNVPPQQQHYNRINYQLPQTFYPGGIMQPSPQQFAQNVRLTSVSQPQQQPQLSSGYPRTPLYNVNAYSKGVSTGAYGAGPTGYIPPPPYSTYPSQVPQGYPRVGTTFQTRESPPIPFRVGTPFQTSSVSAGGSGSGAGSYIQQQQQQQQQQNRQFQQQPSNSALSQQNSGRSGQYGQFVPYPSKPQSEQTPMAQMDRNGARSPYVQTPSVYYYTGGQQPVSTRGEAVSYPKIHTPNFQDQSFYGSTANIPKTSGQHPQQQYSQTPGAAPVQLPEPTATSKVDSNPSSPYRKASGADIYSLYSIEKSSQPGVNNSQEPSAVISGGERVLFNQQKVPAAAGARAGSQSDPGGFGGSYRAGSDQNPGGNGGGRDEFTLPIIDDPKARNQLQQHQQHQQPSSQFTGVRVPGNSSGTGNDYYGLGTGQSRPNASEGDSGHRYYDPTLGNRTSTAGSATGGGQPDNLGVIGGTPQKQQYGNDGHRSGSGQPQQQAPQNAQPQAQTPKASHKHLPHHGGGMPFYSQSEVDNLHQGLSHGTQSPKDSEFENDQGILSWYLQRAKQKLRHRKDGQQDSNHSPSGASQPGHGPNGQRSQESLRSPALQQGHSGQAQQPEPYSYGQSFGKVNQGQDGNSSKATQVSSQPSHSRRLSEISYPAQMVPAAADTSQVDGNNAPSWQQRNADTNGLSQIQTRKPQAPTSSETFQSPEFARLQATGTQVGRVTRAGDQSGKDSNRISEQYGTDGGTDSVRNRRSSEQQQQQGFDNVYSWYFP